MSRFNVWRMVSSAPTVFVDKTDSKLMSFSVLPSGWHYGKGKAIALESIYSAQRIVRIFSEFGVRQTDAFPGVGGELMITAYTDHEYYEVEISAIGVISVIRETNQVENFSESNLDEKVASSRLRELLGEQCSILGYFILNTSIPLGTSSKVWLSKTTTVGRLLFNENALTQLQLPYASTFENITQTPEETRPSSGFSPRAQSHLAVH